MPERDEAAPGPEPLPPGEGARAARGDPGGAGDGGPAPVIVALRRARRGREQAIVLDDGRELAFSAETCARAGVRVGMAATGELVRELELVEQRVAAHEAALRLLTRRARSEREVRDRLRQRGIEPEVAEAETARLREAGLLDDAAFARGYVDDRARLSPRGARMLRHELAARGVARETIDEATRGVDDLETAVALARSRARGAALESYEAFQAKAGAFLQRRGFAFGTIVTALRTVWAEQGDGHPESGEGDPTGGGAAD